MSSSSFLARPWRRGCPLLTVVCLGVSAFGQLGTPLQSTRLLNRNAPADAAPDGPVSIASDVNGFLLAAWSTTDVSLGLGGDPDVVFQVSRDNGATWRAPATFSPAFATDGTASDVEVNVGVNATRYFAVWASNRNASSGAHGIFSASGSGDGTSWVNALPVSNTFASDTADDRRPVIAGSGNTFVVVWERQQTPGESDIWFARTTGNGGPTWSAPAPLQSNAAVDVGNDTNARVLADNAGRWICVWESDDSLGGTIGSDADVLYSLSTDDGLTWSAPALLDPAGASDGSARDLSPSIAYDSPTNTWLVAWSSDVGQGGPLGSDFEVYASRSTNGGVTWSPKFVLNSNAATDASPGGNDLRVQVVSNRNGRFLATWDRLDPAGVDLDVVAARSDDAGVTWTAPVDLKSSSGSDTATDRLPAVAATAQGHVVYAWTSNDALGGTVGTDDDLLYTRNMIPRSDVGVIFCQGAAEVGNASACPCGNDSSILSYEGCVNSTGLGAVAGIVGTTAVSFPTRVITAANLIPGGPVLLFEGTSVVNQGYGSAFGDGLRCIGGTVRRLGVATAGGTGNASLAFSTAGQVAGTTRYYQGWYRDTLAACGAGLFNLSSAEARAWSP